jgi:hypothetical protein
MASWIARPLHSSRVMYFTDFFQHRKHHVLHLSIALLRFGENQSCNVRHTLLLGFSGLNYAGSAHPVEIYRAPPALLCLLLSLPYAAR